MRKDINQGDFMMAWALCAMSDKSFIALALFTMDNRAVCRGYSQTSRDSGKLEILIPPAWKYAPRQYEGYRSQPQVNPASNTKLILKLKTSQRSFAGVPLYLEADGTGGNPQ